MKEGLLLPEGVALLILIGMALGIVVAWANMEEARQVQYRKGCSECREHEATVKREAEEAEKRRQEQHAKELAKMFPPPQEKGVRPPDKKDGGWAV